MRSSPRWTATLWLAIPALALWLTVLVTLVNFYIGNTGLGHGGDSGLLSATLNMLAILIACVALWLLLLALRIWAAIRGSANRLAILADIALLTISLAAALHAQDLVTPSAQATLALHATPPLGGSLPAGQRWPHSPWAWPLLEPALVPLLFMALSLWELSPPMRRRLPAGLAYGGAWGGAALLSLFVFVA